MRMGWGVENWLDMTLKIGESHDSWILIVGCELSPQKDKWEDGWIHASKPLLLYC